MNTISEMKAQLAIAMKGMAACGAAFNVASDEAAKSAEAWRAVAAQAEGVGSDPRPFVSLAILFEGLAAQRRHDELVKDCIDFALALEGKT